MNSKGNGTAIIHSPVTNATRSTTKLPTLSAPTKTRIYAATKRIPLLTFNSSSNCSTNTPCPITNPFSLPTLREGTKKHPPSPAVAPRPTPQLPNRAPEPRATAKKSHAEGTHGFPYVFPLSNRSSRGQMRIPPPFYLNLLRYLRRKFYHANVEIRYP